MINYNLKNLNILGKLRRHAKDMAVIKPPEHMVFCVFCIINYLISLFIWFPNDFTSYTLVLTLRIISGTLCLFLVFQEFWPNWLKRFYALFWIFTLFYCLPFLSTFMFLMNQDSNFWMTGMSLSLFLLATLVNWQLFLGTLFLGVILALIIVFSLNGIAYLNLESLGNLSYILAFSIAVGVLFARRIQQAEKSKVESLKTLSATIAHEMRTPLTTLSIASDIFKTHMGELISCYIKTKHLIEGKQQIEPRVLEYLESAPSNLYRLSRRNLTLIDMLLKKIAGVNDEIALSSCALSACLHRALEEYALDANVRDYVTLAEVDDFNFLGDETLIVHVLFNLLSNSMFQIQTHQKGSITIFTSENQHYNIVHFYDDAGGIPSHVLPLIFNHFYTFGKSEGTGLGLAFCKEVMTKFKGDIRCRSTDGTTQFLLYFPKL